MLSFTKSLRGRILVYMLFAALVPLVVLGYIAATLGESAVADTAGQKFVDFAQQSLDEINGSLTQELAKLELMARTPLITSAAQGAGAHLDILGLSGLSEQDRERRMEETRSLDVSPRVTAFLQDYIRDFGGFSDIIITEHEGHNVVVTERPARFIQKNTRWWQEAMANGTYISDPVQHDMKDLAGLQLAVMVRHNITNEPVGIMMGFKDFTEVTELVEKIAWAIPGGEVQLLDRQGNPLVCAINRGSEVELLTGNEAKAHKLDISGLADGVWSWGKNFEGQESILAHVSGAQEEGALTRLGWSMTVAQPKNIALGATAKLRQTILAIALVAAVLTILIAYYLSSSISRPVAEVAERVQAVASGDLTHGELQVKSRDEVGALTEAFNAMTKDLRRLLNQVQQAASQVAFASEQISASSEEIAAGNQNQAHEVQKTVELVNEIAAALQQMASGARNAAEESDKASRSAEEGGEAVVKAAEAMNNIKTTVTELGQSSRQIGEIVAMIEEIAEQTNLLALNAAIEAARAGDEGRGFAVVAEEVRKLAERSGQATKEISNLVGGIQGNTVSAVKAVEEGVEIANKAGEALRTIIDVVQNTSQLVEDIAQAATRQAANTADAVRAVETVSSITEETASGAEETAASAEELAGMAQTLRDTIGRFRLDVKDDTIEG
jgi:methyl-accepting chemotaxis protein